MPNYISPQNVETEGESNNDLFDIDSFIPENLRKAVEEYDKASLEEDKLLDKESKEPKEPKLKAKAPILEDTEDDLLLLDEEEKPKKKPEPTSKKTVKKSMSLDNPDEIDVDKLLSGEDEIEEEVDEETETPFWHENEKYKSLISNLQEIGIEQEDLDALIQDISDTKVVDNSSYINSLKDDLDKIKEENRLATVEIDRLRQIEKSAYFDTSEETKASFIDPMNKAFSNIQKTLEYEGIELNPVSIVKSLDRASLNTLLEKYDLEESSRNSIIKNWKSYKELQSSYVEAKKSAQNSLGDYLSLSIPEDLSNKVASNSLSEFVLSDNKYEYLRDAINHLNEGKKVDERITTIFNDGKQNFVSILQAMSSPFDHVRNNKFLNGLSKFMWNAAHNSYIADKYYELSETQKKRDADFVKLAKAYKELASSAGGLKGIKKKGGSPLNGASSNPASDDDSYEKDMKMYKDFIKGKISLADLL